MDKNMYIICNNLGVNIVRLAKGKLTMFTHVFIVLGK